MKTRRMKVFAIVLAGSSVGWGTQYYLDAAATGTGDGLSWANAFTTIAAAEKVITDGPATVDVNNGSYGSFSDGTKARTSWVAYRAAAGKTPVFSHIHSGAGGETTYDKYLDFNGITITPGHSADSNDNIGAEFHCCHWVKIRNCKIESNYPWVRYDDSVGLKLNQSCADIDVNNTEILEFERAIYGATSGTRGPNDVNVLNCTIHDCFWVATVAGARWVFDNCDVYDVQDGINITAPDCSVTDCNMHDFKDPCEAWHADAVQLYSSGDWIPHNFTARRNLIHTQSHHGFGLRGVTGKLLTGLVLENNVVWNTTTTMVDVDGFIAPVIRGNTFVRGNSGFAGTTYIRDCNNVTLMGNLMTYATYETANTTFADCNYNIYYKQSAGSVLPGSHNTKYGTGYESLLNANCKDYDANDFTLAAGADAVDYVDLSSTPATDYAGNIRVDIAGVGHEGVAYADCGAYELGGTSEDTTAPTPNPMTFATAPYATSSSSIRMVATTATDPSGVQYYFTCTTGAGHDSSWQDEVVYVDTGLAADTTYGYTVKARDKSVNNNTTAASSQATAKTSSATTYLIGGILRCTNMLPYFHF